MYFIWQDSFSGVPRFSQWFLLNVLKNEGFLQALVSGVIQIILKWFSRSTILLFNESMLKVCDVIISVFPEIRDKLVSPNLIVWMADFLAALIEFLMLSYWEDILFSTYVICCFRSTNFSSIRVLSSLIGSTWVLVAFMGWESWFGHF